MGPTPPPDQSPRPCPRARGKSLRSARRQASCTATFIPSLGTRSFRRSTKRMTTLPTQTASPSGPPWDPAAATPRHPPRCLAARPAASPSNRRSPSTLTRTPSVSIQTTASTPSAAAPPQLPRSPRDRSPAPAPTAPPRIPTGSRSATPHPRELATAPSTSWHDPHFCRLFLKSRGKKRMVLMNSKRCRRGRWSRRRSRRS
mmetsp:Transcript_18686/g.46936  ORF Transcript_18686/g.46936 Transcript_18686/m.46936 type:complete len:201 (+) Transcript_18686:143-745(+)